MQRRLLDHYVADMNALNEDAAALPPNLYFTYCGDILGSCGKHYEKGEDVSLEDAARRAYGHYSDDFAESLAMHQLAHAAWSCDLESLIKQRDDFLNIIRGHYIAYGMQYSPWAAALFEEKNVGRYGVLLSKHIGCGGAMRAAALAPHKHLDAKGVLPFFLITHAHAQAVEGAYFIWGMACAILNGADYQDAVVQARDMAREGRDMALVFLKENNLPHDDTISVLDACDVVMKTRDPYAAIKDIAEEGIDTHYVVSSALLILDEMNAGKGGDDPAAYLIERGLKIGGDPDTVCSIAMGLAGLLWPDKLKSRLDDIEIKAGT